MGRERQGKSARVGKAIQRSPARIIRGCGAIFALVEKPAGLLPVQQVEAHLHAIFFHHDFADVFPRQHAALLRQALKAAHGGIIALKDGAGREFLLQDLHHRGLQPVHALAESLNDEAIAVAVDDERGKQIAFGSNQPISLRPGRHLLAESGRGANSLGEEGGVKGPRFARQEAQRDLRLAAVKSLPPEVVLLDR